MREPNFNCLCCIPEFTPDGAPARSGRYPWPNDYKPIFANKYAIGRGMTQTVTHLNGHRFEYHDKVNMIQVIAVISGTTAKGMGLDDLAHMAVNILARRYDDIMIRRVFHMDYARFQDFSEKIKSAGGSMFLCDRNEIQGVVTGPEMVRIEMPADKLKCLHMDGDSPKDELSFFWDRDMPAIRRVQTFNDRAIVVTFRDGTQTKCVADVDEDGNSNFDLYTGIAFCITKRMLGEDGHKRFNSMIRRAMKVLDEQEEQEKKFQEMKDAEKRRNEKKKLKAYRRKVKKLEAQVKAYVDALQNLPTDIAVEYAVPDPNALQKALSDAIDTKSKPEIIPETCSECCFQSKDMKCNLLPDEQQSCPVTFHQDLVEEAEDDVFKAGRRCLCPLDNE